MYIAAVRTPVNGHCPLYTAPQLDVHSFKENLRVHGIGDHSLQFQLPEPTAFELRCEEGTEEKDELHVLPPFIEVTLDPV